MSLIVPPTAVVSFLPVVKMVSFGDEGVINVDTSLFVSFSMFSSFLVIELLLSTKDVVL